MQLTYPLGAVTNTPGRKALGSPTEAVLALEPQQQGLPGKVRHKPRPLPNTPIRPGPRSGRSQGQTSRACPRTRCQRQQTPSHQRKQLGLRGTLQNHPIPQGSAKVSLPSGNPPRLLWARLTFLNSGSAMLSCVTLGKSL